MENLFLVFKQATVWIGEFLDTCTSHWYLQILLFLIVLQFIVTLLLVFRGKK